jgi:glucokinase
LAEILIGIDLGATNVRVGALTPSGEMLYVDETELDAEGSSQTGLELIARMVTLVMAQTAGARLLGLGIGSTGPTDPMRGVILDPGTLPGWRNVPIAAFLSKRFEAPACLENDADAAALGEYWMGVGQGMSRLYAVTVGTGIGTGFVVDGEVYRGENGFHPEGGHQIVDPSGPECYCGGRGCWESWASGSAIAQAAQRVLELWLEHDRQEASGAPVIGQYTPQSILLQMAGGDPARVEAKFVTKAARQGDPIAAAVIRAASERFATGIFNIIMLFHPDMIVLSGGVMRSSDLFWRDVERVRAAAQVSVPAQRIQIKPAQLGYYAGVYGAAYAAWRRFHGSGRPVSSANASTDGR